MNFKSRIEQWIHSVKVPVATHEDIETPPEDIVSTAHLSIRQLKAKQSLTQLKLKQLTQNQELVRQEEETKLKLEVWRHSMKSKIQTCKLSCCKMKISITLIFRWCLKSWIRLKKELKDELQESISRKTLSPEVDRNQLNPKVHRHSWIPMR